MGYFVINGGNRLEGEVTISGAKNAALAIIPATILSGESCVIENLPAIQDVRILAEIFKMIGAKTDLTKGGACLLYTSDAADE